jgi:LPXTG-motif cell wall-anchored protein
MKISFKHGLIVALCLALIPLIASAQPPKPKGTLVYDDNFSDSKKSGLEDNLNATDYSRGFHAPGVYHLILLKNNDTRWSLFPNKSFGDFTIELDVWDNSDDFTGDVSEGVIVRAQDETHLYSILIDPRKGQYGVRKLDGKDKWTDLIAMKASPLIKTKEAVNHLRVDAAGSTFTIYLNDEQLDTFTDAAYKKGSLGLIASNVDATRPHMHFDNVKLYTAEAAPAAQATAAPTTATPAATPTGSPSTLPATGQGSDNGVLLWVSFALALLGLGVWVRAEGRRQKRK